MSVTAHVPIPIAAFNIEPLGDTKMGMDDVVDVLRQIMFRHAICMVQGIDDIDESTPNLLLSKLNMYDGNNDFDFKLSLRLGSGIHTEQYGIYYRQSFCTHQQSYSYSDPNNKFERPPYGAVFNCPSFGADCFGVVVVHTKPDDAVSEIDALRDVYDDFKSVTSCPNVLIMGDFNADCDYVTPNRWNNIRLWTDSAFKWLVDNSVDTTVTSTNCSYDRIVVNQENAYRNRLVNTGPFKFEGEIPLGTVQKADDVSDHYPVEVGVKSSSSGITVSDGICIKYSIGLSTKQDVLAKIVDATLTDQSLTKTEDGEQVKISGSMVSDMSGMLDALIRKMPKIFPWFEMHYVRRAWQSHIWSGCKFFDDTQTGRCATTSKNVKVTISDGSVRFCVKFSV